MEPQKRPTCRNRGSTNAINQAHVYLCPVKNDRLGTGALLRWPVKTTVYFVLSFKILFLLSVW